MNETFEYPAPRLFIDGYWRMGSGGDMLDVRNPASGAGIASLPVANKADLDEALASARRTFARWRNTSAFDRANILHKAANLLRERAHYIGQVGTTEQGKVLSEATAEAFASADIFDWFAEEGRRAYGSNHSGQAAWREAPGDQAAHRTRRSIFAVEFSDNHPFEKDRCSTGGRVLDDHQAR